MAIMSKSVEIRASAQAVWDIVVDFPNMPKWLKALPIVKLPDAPKTGLGTRRHVSPGGPILIKEIVTHWEAPRLFGYAVQSGAPVKKHQGLIEITPSGGGVRVEYSTEIETGIPLAGMVLDRLVCFLVNEGIGQALKDLKKYAER